jgi:hypothetical protein
MGTSSIASPSEKEVRLTLSRALNGWDSKACWPPREFLQRYLLHSIFLVVSSR